MKKPVKPFHLESGLFFKMAPSSATPRLLSLSEIHPSFMGAEVCKAVCSFGNGGNGLSRGLRHALTTTSLSEYDRWTIWREMCCEGKPVAIVLEIPSYLSCKVTHGYTDFNILISMFYRNHAQNRAISFRV